MRSTNGRRRTSRGAIWEDVGPDHRVGSLRTLLFTYLVKLLCELERDKRIDFWGSLERPYPSRQGYSGATDYLELL